MGRTRVLVVAVSAWACSLITPLDELTRDGGQRDGSSDAPSDAGLACNPAAPFGPPSEVAQLVMSDASSSSARLSKDELTVYFNADWPGGAGKNDLFVATRPTPVAVFGTPARLTGVNSATEDWDPTVTGDGLILYFGSLRSVPENIFVSTRSATSDPFVLPAPAPGLNQPDAASFEPYVLPDHRAIYFSSTRVGGMGNADIYRAEWIGAAFAAPVHVDNVSSASNDSLATVSADERLMILASNRPGGVGGVDIWVSRRSNVALPFDVPINVTELNSARDDYPSSISDDGCRVLLLSNRSSFYRIYESRRP